MSKNAKIIDMRVDSRVEAAIRNAMDIYMNKLASGFIEVGLEDAFKMHFADIFSRELNQNTFFADERFMVKFVKNMPINGNNDYIDIVIEYKIGLQISLYLIELKFKKVSDSAPDLGNIESYKDIYNLDCHKQSNPSVAGCYFIFLTNYGTYLNQSTLGTRTQIPMYDGYTIQANHNYIVTGPSALKATA
ncbi:MAG TPA: hypothetical protein GX708_14850 [Gallicola sp.]|nr:hypothetical protein [Gallicola sp.]